MFGIFEHHKGYMFLLGLTWLAWFVFWRDSVKPKLRAWRVTARLRALRKIRKGHLESWPESSNSALEWSVYGNNIVFPKYEVWPGRKP